MENKLEVGYVGGYGSLEDEQLQPHVTYKWDEFWNPICVPDCPGCAQEHTNMALRLSLLHREMKEALKPEFCPNCGQDNTVTVTAPESLSFDLNCLNCGACYEIRIRD